LVSLSDSSKGQENPNDSSSHPNALLGDLLALVSAVFYALYVTLLKARIREESRIDMKLFFGFVGLYNILLSWILGLMLHVLGIEKFQIPSGRNILLGIAVNVSTLPYC
jgi:solute carrier family 35, member F5